jgi:hypothetical protein
VDLFLLATSATGSPKLFLFSCSLLQNKIRPIGLDSRPRFAPGGWSPKKNKNTLKICCMSSFMIVLILVFVCLVIFAALSDESRVSGFGSPSPGMKSDFEISRNNKQFIRLQRNFERLVESEKRKGAGLFQSDAEKLQKKRPGLIKDRP